MNVRQGDITLIRVADRDPPTPPRDLVLAYGEESGHYHHITLATEIRDPDGRRYVVVGHGAQLRTGPAGHEHRHAPIDVPGGTYEIPGIGDASAMWAGQREYTPSAIRAVGD